MSPSAPPRGRGRGRSPSSRPPPGLVTRASAQTLAFFVALIFLLVAPAGSLAFWQAWVYVGIFVVATASLTAYLLWRDPGLLDRRLAVGERGEPDPEQRRILLLCGGSFFAMLVFTGLDVRFGWSKVPYAAVIVANVVVAIGFFLVFLVFRSNTYTSSVVEVAPGQQLVSTGPYAIVRHPMYSAALLVILASPLALGSWWGFMFLPPLVFGIVARIQAEERTLVDQLAGYREYTMRTTKRLIPGIW